MTDDERDIWESRRNRAAWLFAVECSELHRTDPYKEIPVLDNLINTLMTELWDRGFSQTEIRTAFELAIADMPRYAAGLEKRSDGPH